MIPHNNLVGSRVRILPWEDLRHLFPADPDGTITHVAPSGDGSVEVTVRVDGMKRDYIFNLDEVELLSRTNGMSADPDRN